VLAGGIAAWLKYRKSWRAGSLYIALFATSKNPNGSSLLSKLLPQPGLSSKILKHDREQIVL